MPLPLELIGRRDNDRRRSRLGDIICRLASTNEGEIIATAFALRRLLEAHGVDIHALVEQLENGGGAASAPQLNAAQMQRIYDTAYQKGFADGSEHGRKNAIIAAPSVGTFSIGAGVNSYSWQQIAQHCLANKHLFHGRDYEFIESVAAQLECRPTPSPPQAKWLKDLFMRGFNGRID